MDSSWLWATVRVTAHTPLEALRLQLERSRIRPLDLHIRFEASKESLTQPTPVSFALSVLDILLDHLPRWRQLRIVSPFPKLVGAMLARLGGTGLRAPILEVLEVDCPFHSILLGGNPNGYPRPFPGGAPRLQHIRLDHCGFSLSADEPFPQLTSFEIASAPWTLVDLHSLATTSPRLTYLSVRSSYKLEANVELHFPALRFLKIGDYFQNDTILRVLHAPALEVLQIEEMEIEHYSLAGRYIDALRGETYEGTPQGKFPRLRSLRLHMTGRPEEPSPLIVGARLGEFLGLFPSIVHLAFAGFHVHAFAQGFLELMQAPSVLSSPAAGVLPRLEHLTLGTDQEHESAAFVNGWGPLLFDMVRAIVVARRAAGRPLKKVQVPPPVLVRLRRVLGTRLMLKRLEQLPGVDLEGVQMPFTSDVWLGYRWALRVH
ncbi:uncharacterized protein FIBRA_01737 [Fibroporia radiculosa]|uniref:F-box domain-containing protein n=1 Tax=Fibroporia radiculosa TaxID=599839 RepID=J4GL70_9APHY|nr:uncharacterized protein FIBRA_01737 [Fibroporia radiculosa]CCL99715.1 predicted protein [Fibroporia radiculosa]